MAGALAQSFSPDILGKELVSQVKLPEENTDDIKVGDWRYDIYQYLDSGQLPKESKRRPKVKVMSMRFVLLNRILYKRSFSRPLLKCLGKEEACYVLKKIHKRCCGNHLGSIALARKALLAGYEDRRYKHC